MVGWRAAIVWGGGVFLLWLVVYCGANWITGLHGYRVTPQTQLDSMLPFVPATAIIYLSLFPMLWLSPFVLRSPARLWKLARALAIVIVTSGIGFILVPAEPIDAISTGTHAFGKVFHFADWINLTHNYFPSLHVAIAVTCAVCYGHSTSPAAAILFWLWAAMIALATLVTRQHYIADVFAGAILGIAVAIYYARQDSNLRPAD